MLPKPRRDPAEARKGWRSNRELIVQNLEFIYGPVLISSAFLFFFAFADPAQEAIIGYLGEFDLLLKGDSTPEDTIGRRVALSTFLLCCIPFATYFLSDRLLRHYNERNRMVWIMLLGIPLTTIAGYTLGFWRALRSGEIEASGDVILFLSAIGIVLVLQLVFILSKPYEGKDEVAFRGYFRAMQEVYKWTLAQSPLAFLVDFRRWEGRIYVGLILLLLFTIFVGFFNHALAAWFGPIGISAAAALLMMALLALFTRLSDHLPGNFPIILLVVGLIAGLGNPVVAGLTLLITLALLARALQMKHGPTAIITLLSFALLSGVYLGAQLLGSRCASLAGCNPQEGVPLAQGARLETLENAQEVFRFTNTSQPMRVVAAQGGGLYAAFHTAYYLAYRADTEPDFATSVFAISGVSGGSVGATVYWAIRKSDYCKENPSGNCHRKAVRQVFQRDYLSPVLAGLLFSDNLDSVIPISALTREPMDRGRTMERMLARVLAKLSNETGATIPADILDTPLSGSPDLARGAPILLLNATRVDNGEKWVASPLVRHAPGQPERILTAAGNDLSVGNAAVNSARFPFVTPPARVAVELCPDFRRPPCADRAVPSVHRVQLADGGYGDNSGVTTLMEMLPHIRKRRPLEVITLISEEPEFAPSIKGTTGAPVNAFMASWRETIRQNLRTLEQRYPTDPSGPSNVAVVRAPVRPEKFNFTVSWYLAPGTFCDIERQVEADLTERAPKTRRVLATERLLPPPSASVSLDTPARQNITCDSKQARADKDAP